MITKDKFEKIWENNRVLYKDTKTINKMMSEAKEEGKQEANNKERIFLKSLPDWRDNLYYSEIMARLTKLKEKN